MMKYLYVCILLLLSLNLSCRDYGFTNPLDVNVKITGSITLSVSSLTDTSVTVSLNFENKSLESRSKKILLEKSHNGTNYITGGIAYTESNTATVFTDIIPDTNYTFRVIVYFGDNKSEYSTTGSKVLNLKPIDLEILELTERSVKLKWDNSSTLLLSTLVERSIDNQTYELIGEALSGASTVEIEKEFITNQRYYFRIYGRTKSAVTKYSNTINTSISFNPPSSLTAQLTTETNGLLSWQDNSSFETSFVIEISEDGNNYSVIKEVPANTTSTDIEGIYLTNKTYRFRVRGKSELNHTEYSNIATSNLTFNPPTNLIVSFSSSNKATLNWNDNSTYETGFEIELSEDGTNYSRVKTVPANTTSTEIEREYLAGVTYYFRIKAKSNYNESQYSNVANVIPDKPVVTTISVTNISFNSATSGGNVSSQGSFEVIARGVCWSTSENPTIADNKTSDGTGTGSFTSSITGLPIGTKYFVRAYATSSAGTSYGEQFTFTTLALPTVNTNGITNITTISASGGGNVTSQGSSSVTSRGVCWSTSQNPTIADSKTIDGSGLGSFTSSITGLTPNTKYYIRAYSITNVGTGYGEELSFTTNQVTLPTVETFAEVTNITSISASSGGNVFSDGGASVIARGVCWSTTQNPTIAESKTTNGTGTGSFTSSITGLLHSTTYYVRAYATNVLGTSYGAEINFTSSSFPTVTTTPLSNISANFASSGGNVISQGSTSVTARGVCWSTNQNPTIADSKTSNGTGTGSFTSAINGLTPNTTYYVRAYATNNSGTGYGNQLSFTSTPFICGITTIPFNGKSYSTVLIGNQCWFVENLDVGIRINGSSSQTNNGTIEKYCYNDLESNCTTYGGLYQWGEVMQYLTNPASQGICPHGWHIPTYSEFLTLKNNVFNNGNSLKGIGQGSGPGAGTNISGFSALLAGSRSTDAIYTSFGYSGYFWSSTEHSASNSFNLALYYNTNIINLDGGTKGYGFSVRCIKD